MHVLKVDKFFITKILVYIGIYMYICQLEELKTTEHQITAYKPKGKRSLISDRMMIYQC